MKRISKSFKQLSLQHFIDISKSNQEENKPKKPKKPKKRKESKNKKKFYCDACTEMFISNSSLTIHFRMHTGEMPYTCSFCPLRFKWSGSVKNHLKRVHNKDLPVCFVKNCKKRFALMSAMQNHYLRVHGGLKVEEQIKDFDGNLVPKGSELEKKLLRLASNLQVDLHFTNPF